MEVVPVVGIEEVEDPRRPTPSLQPLMRNFYANCKTIIPAMVVLGIGLSSVSSELNGIHNTDYCKLLPRHRPRLGKGQEEWKWSRKRILSPPPLSLKNDNSNLCRLLYWCHLLPEGVHEGG